MNTKLTSRPTTKAIGNSSETLALSYLHKQGLSLIERNYTTRLGEIDLIMNDGNIIVFIEVRLRTSTQYGHPSETVTSRKQQRIIKTATLFLQEKGWLQLYPCRFDVITFQSIETNSTLHWIKDAFRIN